MTTEKLERLTKDEVTIVQAYRNCHEVHRSNIYEFALASAKASREDTQRKAGAQVVLLSDPLRKFR